MPTADTLGKLIEAATIKRPYGRPAGLAQRAANQHAERLAREARDKIVASAPALLACVRALEPFAVLFADYEEHGLIDCETVKLVGRISRGPGDEPPSVAFADFRAAAQTLAALEAGE